MTAGISTAVKATSPETQLFAVEPVGFEDTLRSLKSGKREQNASAGGSICDAIISPMPGELTFPINKSLLSGVLTVTDDQALAAVGYAATELKMIVEPGGVVCLAAALNQREVFAGKTAILMLSGGNIDPEMLTKALSM